MINNNETLEELRKLQTELENISKRIEELIRNCNMRPQSKLIETDAKTDAPDMEKVVTDYLLQLGMSTSVLGFKYARAAIVNILCSEQEKRLYVTKRIYPEIAEQFNVTASRVERAIRHVIHRTFEKNRENVLVQEIAMNTHGCYPTNSEFLAFIAEKIRLEN